MKLSLTIIFSFIWSVGFGQPASFRAVYEMSGQPDSTDEKSLYTEIMFLDVFPDLSVFQSREKFLSDSILNSEAFQQNVFATGEIDMRQLPRSKQLFKVIKDYKLKRIIFRNRLGINGFEYNSPMDSLQWHLEKDTATISGYLCSKATTCLAGRCYTAWYTTEIPFPDGPYKFCNLPGFIIDIFDCKKYYEFRLLNITHIKTQSPGNELQHYTSVSKNEYFAYIEKAKKTPEILLQSSQQNNQFQIQGANMDELIEKRLQKLKEQMKKNNNPIEFF